MEVLSLERIQSAWQKLGAYLAKTPVQLWSSDLLVELLGPQSQVWLKLELFQKSGSFKARGALINLLELSAEQRQAGVVAASAGNHAVAVAFAARTLSISAKLLMPKNVNAARLALCKKFGAEILFYESLKEAFEHAKQIEREERRALIHPFEGELTALGTATLGYEFAHQVPDLDLLVVPVGGGGLAAGVSAAVKQLQPSCKIIGVEPEGANSMQCSFEAGSPQSIDRVQTIADSLGAPYALPYSFGLCRKFVDEIVTVSDDQMCSAIYRVFTEMKLALEPAGACSSAALLFKLAEQAKGKRVGLIVCGSNIDSKTFCQYLSRGESACNSE